MMIIIHMQVCTEVWSHQSYLRANTNETLDMKATNSAIIRGLGLNCSKGKNAARAIGHNLTLGYIIGYDQHASTCAKTRQDNLRHIRDAQNGEECYESVICCT